MRLVTRDNVINYLTPGLAVWRPVDWQCSRVLDVTPVINDRGPLPSVRVLPDGFRQAIPEPVVNPYSRPGGPAFGIVCFVTEALPDDWTHLEILSSCTEPRKCLYAVPRRGDIKSYLEFRRDVVTACAGLEPGAALMRACRLIPDGLADARRQFIYREGVYWTL